MLIHGWGGGGNAFLEIFMIHLFPLMMFPHFMHSASNIKRVLICAVACIVGILFHNRYDATKKLLSKKMQKG